MRSQPNLCPIILLPIQTLTSIHTKVAVFIKTEGLLGLGNLLCAPQYLSHFTENLLNSSRVGHMKFILTTPSSYASEKSAYM